MILVAGTLALGTLLLPVDPGEEVLRILERQPDDQRSRTEVVQALAGLGARGLPGLFELQAGLDAPLEPSTGAWWCPPDELPELALEALGQLPVDTVLEHVGRDASADTELQHRLASLRVLGRLGDARGLPLLCTLAATFEPRELRSPTVRGTVTLAVEAIVRTDGTAVPWLVRSVEELEPPLLRLLVEGALAAGRPSVSDFLLAALRTAPAEEPFLLGHLAELQARYAWRLGPEVAGALRGRLMAEQPDRRRAAARAIARTGDTEAVPLLVGNLADPDASVRRSALEALRELTGQRSATSTEEWNTWLSAERAWWESEGDALLEDVASKDAGRVYPAVRTLARRPLHRHRVAAALSEVLAELPDELAAHLAGTMAELDSGHGVPGLVDLLFEGGVRGREAAWQALRSLTGLDLPAEPRLWESALNA
jgi:HEAT repeat protein